MGNARNLVHQLADSENELARAKREESAIRASWFGAITGAIGALTGVAALVVTILRQ